MFINLINKIFKQDAVIFNLKEKWQNIAFSTESINQENLTKTIKELYHNLGFQEPEIRYFSSPYQLINYLLDEFIRQLELNVINNLIQSLIANNDLTESEKITILVKELNNNFKILKNQQLGQSLSTKIETIWSNQLKPLDHLDQTLMTNWENQLRNTPVNQEINILNAQHLKYLETKILGLIFSKLIALIPIKENQQFLIKLINLTESQRGTEFVTRLGNILAKNLFWNNFIYPEIWSIANSRFEFYGQVLKLAKTASINQTFNQLLANSGWIFPFNKVCLVSDRPLKLSLDLQHRLHQEGGLAMLYNDGYGVYAYHGVILPKLYGEKEPSQWKAEWILSETNAELRRTLIQGIGYDRLCQELNPLVVDNWREYTLLCFENIIDPIDERPIYLLKMTCPSTGFIHGLRVPPDLRSAKEAILWINWGVDPDDIAMES